jgi:dTDP-4-amino-4,6-dideoxygalactose transaminase
MEFIDLKAQFRRIEPRLRARMDAVLAHGRFIMGPEVEELEARLAEFTGARHCISCASGTDALIMTLMAWGIGPGDAVFVPPFSFFATGEAPALLGATPVMVDIAPGTFNMDAAALDMAAQAVKAQDPSMYPLPRAALAHPLRPRAVITVDLFGQPADYAAILPVSQKCGLLVLEDATQAFGAEYRGKKTCALGCHAAAASFFPAKPLGCYGDGGAVFTDDASLADVLRSIRTHGKGGDKYDNVRLGINGRLDTLQAAVLLAKLEIFAEELASRRRVAAWYGERLAGIPGLTLPVTKEGEAGAWSQYTLRITDKRDALAARLKEQGIPTNIYYPKPMHMLDAFKPLGYKRQDMPRALAASREVLSLPFHPYMTGDEVSHIAQAVREAMR